MKYLKYFLRAIKKGIKYIAKKSAPFLIIILFFIISFWGEGYTLEDFGIEEINLNPFDYCNITDVDYTAILHDDPNGKANVEITEYLTFDVHAGSKLNLYKELWRELPEEFTDGLKVTYDVESVTQILDDGTELSYLETDKMYWEDYDYTPSSTMRWHHSDGNGKYPDNDESVLIYIPWTYREKMKFKIVYSMNNAALKYNDCSELYLSMYSGNTIKKLKSYKAQILIPNDIMPKTYYTYTFGTANARIPYTESNSINPGYHTFSINLNKADLKFNYHNRYIEFCLLAYGKDKQIFTKYAPNNRYSYQNALDECIAEDEYYATQNEKFNNYKKILLIASGILSIFVIFNAKMKYKKVKQSNEFYEPEINYKYFRDIPSDLDPIFASELVFMKDPFNENKEKQEEYAAILLSLVRKKYVKVSKHNESKDWDTQNTIISVKNNINSSTPETPEFLISKMDESDMKEYNNSSTNLEPLTTSERLYLQLIERHTRAYNDISLSALHRRIIERNTEDYSEYSEISLSTLQRKIDEDFEYTNSFIKDIEKKPELECGVMQGYFRQTDYDMYKKQFETSAKRSLIWSMILLFVVNTISYFTPIAFGFGAYTLLGIALLVRFIYLKSKAGDLVLFTQYGVDEQAKWIGLYNFLNSETLMNEKNVPDLVLWEKYLIYATAFGISDKVVKALKIHTNELNIDNSLILNTRFYIHSTHFHSTSRSLGHSIHTTSRGGGFGGHGYGGGGRGGRRWRRRSLIS